jgi:Phage protein Gp138 N-terminal domain/Chaperone of endosialidase
MPNWGFMTETIQPNIAQRLALESEQWKLNNWQLLSKIHVAMPGIILAYDAATQTVQVQLAIKDKIVLDNLRQDREFYPIAEVPLVLPRAGGFALTVPVMPGDECLVIFADMCIDAWWTSGGSDNSQQSRRRHNISDGFAVLGTWSQPRRLPLYSPATAQFRTDDGATYVEVTPTDVNVVTGALGKAGIGSVMKLNPVNVSVVAPEQIVHQAAGSVMNLASGAAHMATAAGESLHLSAGLASLKSSIGSQLDLGPGIATITGGLRIPSLAGLPVLGTDGSGLFIPGISGGGGGGGGGNVETPPDGSAIIGTGGIQTTGALVFETIPLPPGHIQFGTDKIANIHVGSAGIRQLIQVISGAYLAPDATSYIASATDVVHAQLGNPTGMAFAIATATGATPGATIAVGNRFTVDWAGNVYLPSLPSAETLATDASGKIIAIKFPEPPPGTDEASGSYLYAYDGSSVDPIVQGSYIMWNAMIPGSGGMDFICNRGGGQGGFYWWDSAPSGSPINLLASMYTTGLFSSQFLNAYGNMGPGPYNPKTNGVHIGWNYSGGAGEGAFINNMDGGSPGGFRFYNCPTPGNPVTHIATIDMYGIVLPAGSITVSSGYVYVTPTDPNSSTLIVYNSRYPSLWYSYGNAYYLQAQFPDGGHPTLFSSSGLLITSPLQVNGNIFMQGNIFQCTSTNLLIRCSSGAIYFDTNMVMFTVDCQTTVRMVFYSPDQTRYLTIGTANGGHPTLYSNTGQTDINGGLAVYGQSNLSGVSCGSLIVYGNITPNSITVNYLSAFAVIFNLYNVADTGMQLVHPNADYGTLSVGCKDGYGYLWHSKNNIYIRSECTIVGNLSVYQVITANAGASLYLRATGGSIIMDLNNVTINYTLTVGAISCTGAVNGNTLTAANYLWISASSSGSGYMQFCNNGQWGNGDPWIYSSTGLLRVYTSLYVENSLTGNGTVRGNGRVEAGSDMVIWASGSGSGYLQFADNGGQGSPHPWIFSSTGYIKFVATFEGDINTNSRLSATMGIYCRAGQYATQRYNWFNIDHDVGQYMWVDATLMGRLAYQSDYRMKKNIEPLKSALDVVLKLRPIVFEWRNPPSLELYDTGPIQVGLLAHEVQELIPSAVNCKKDALNSEGEMQPQSLNWPPLIALLIRAVQELSDKVNQIMPEVN